MTIKMLRTTRLLLVVVIAIVGLGYIWLLLKNPNSDRRRHIAETVQVVTAETDTWALIQWAEVKIAPSRFASPTNHAVPMQQLLVAVNNEREATVALLPLDPSIDPRDSVAFRHRAQLHIVDVESVLDRTIPATIHRWNGEGWRKLEDQAAKSIIDHVDVMEEGAEFLRRSPGSLETVYMWTPGRKIGLGPERGYLELSFNGGVWEVILKALERTDSEILFTVDHSSGELMINSDK